MAGNIKGITIQIGADTTKLSSALHSADKAIRDTQKQLTDVNKALKFDPGNTDLLRDKQKLLAERIQATKDKLTALQKAQDALDAKGVDKSSKEYQDLQTQIDLTKSKLSGLEDEAKKFHSAFSQKIAAIGDKVQGVGKKITSVGEGLSKSVTAPIAGVAAASAAAWHEVDDAMDTVVTKTGASGEALEGMQQSVTNIADSIPTSFEAAGNAVGEVNTRFGLTGQALEDLSKQFVEFATINDVDVSTAVDSTQAAMAAFGVQASDAGVFLDTLNKAGQDTGVSVTQLADGMTKNGAALQEMGMSASDAAMFLANLDKNGVDSSTAMTGLKAALKNATADGTTMQDSLSKLNETMHSGKSDTEKMQAAVDVFGSKAGPILGKAMIDGKLNLDSLGTSMQDFAGNTEEAFNGTLDPADQMTVALNNLKTIGSELFTAAQTVATPFLEQITAKMQELSQWFQNLSPEQQEMIVKIAAVAAAIGPLLIVIGKLVTAFGAIMSAAPAIGAAFTVLAGPVGIVIAVIAGAVTAGILLYKNWDKIKAKASKLKQHIGEKWNEIKEKTSEAWDNVKEKVGNAWDGIKDKVANSAVGQAASEAWDKVKTTTSEAMSNIKQSVDEHGGGIKGVFTALGDHIKNSFSDGFQAAGGSADSFWESLKISYDEGGQGLAGSVQAAFDLQNQAVRGFFTTVGDLFGVNLQGVSDKVTGFNDSVRNTITDGLNSVKDKTTAFFDAVGAKAESGWTAVKDKTTSAFEGIKSTVSAGWENAKTNTTNILNAIKASYDAHGGGMKGAVNATGTAIKSTFNLVWAAANTATGGKLASIASSTRSKMSDMASTVSSKLESVKGFFGSKLGSAASTVGDKLGAAASAAKSKMDSLKNAVKSGLDAVGSFFHGLHWELPSIKLPHFSMSGKFSLNPPSVPTIGVSWYDKGGIFRSPTLIGVGEKRPEIVGALDDFRQIVREEAGSGSTEILAQMLDLLKQMAGAKPVTVTQNIYAQETSYAGQQKQAERRLREIGRALA